MNEEIAAVNGIAITYESFGPRQAPPVLLIMGLGAQMIDWREEFCALISNRGFRVIRFDNRDIGKSEKFHDAEMPNPFDLVAKVTRGDPIDVPYSIRDMAEDAMGLLEELKLERTHVVGLSMGGMIAQRMAIEHQERLLSLTSIMSSARYIYPPSAEAAELLNKPAPKNLEEYIEYTIENSKVLNGPAFPIEESLYREHAIRRFERGIYPPGFARQLAAVIVQEDRRKELGSLSIPTLVLHGTSDPLVPVQGGIETAEAVPNAKLKLVEGWGHGLPPSIWPLVTDELISHFESI